MLALLPLTFDQELLELSPGKYIDVLINGFIRNLHVHIPSILYFEPF